MIRILKKSVTYAVAIISVVFTFVPESVFEKTIFILRDNYKNNDSIMDINIILNRVLVFVIVWGIVWCCCWLSSKCRRKVIIKRNNYALTVEYGDILNVDDCKRVIPFDECFTTNVGKRPSDIKEASICGQYLQSKPDFDIKELISNSNL